MLTFNPLAGSLHGRLSIIDTLEQSLLARGIDVDRQPTKCAGDATRLAKLAVDDGYDAIVVCGGDGTINEALQSLVGSQTVLAAYPCGTANVLACELGLKRDPEQFSNLLATGQTQRVSVGRASQPNTEWQRFFLLMAGIGPDAAIARSVNTELKKRIGEGAYFISAMDYLARWPLRAFTIEVDGQSVESTFAIVANAPGYGGGFVVAPGARMDDGVLNACLFQGSSRLSYLLTAALARSGKHIGRNGIAYHEGQRFVATSEFEVHVQLDGEPAGTLPMNFDVVTDAVTLITAR